MVLEAWGWGLGHTAAANGRAVKYEKETWR